MLPNSEEDEEGVDDDEDIEEEDAEVADLQLGRPQIIFKKNYHLSFGVLLKNLAFLAEKYAK